MKKECEIVMQLQNDGFLMNNLVKHFFKSKKDVYVFESDKIIGIITYSAFINNLDNILSSIQRIDESFCAEQNNEELNNVVVSTDIISRFDELYKDNDKIIDYLRSLNIKKVVILGSIREKISNYIDMYGNNFETITCNDIDKFMSYLDDDVLIIDTDSDITNFKNKLSSSYSLLHRKSNRHIFSLEEICELSEYYYFVNVISKNSKAKIAVLEFPDIYKLDNITDEEKSRILFDHHYRYYYDRYKQNDNINQLLKKVFGPLYSDEFIESRNHMPNVFLKNGRFFLENSDNPYCSSYNGERNTTDQRGDYNFQLNFFGPCLVFGALVDDGNTICSFLQRKINDEGYDYRVHNYGARAIAFLENVRSYDGIILSENDFTIFVVNQEEKKKLESMGYYDFIDLKPVFEDKTLRDYFIDEPVHCNHVANERISNYTFSKIKSNLLRRNINNKELAKPIRVPKLKNVFKNNNYLKEYLELLKKYKANTDNNGCILMNCNPFTKGHYKLIEYASKCVPTLYVFVVQENKSSFSFEDRFNMVKEGCRDFPNVIVIPSGKIFASAMLFPEYFNKEENKEVIIDVSLDRELFTQYIAPTLSIKKRFVGEENIDLVTRAYNQDIKKNLPLYGVDVIEIPRFKEDNQEISAKVVRKALEDNDWSKVESLVPLSTLKLLKKKRGDR